MRATEINKGSYRGDLDNNGQWGNRMLYCPECHSHDGKPHKNDCIGNFVGINPTARIPRKNASKKQWELFNKKFVV